MRFHRLSACPAGESEGDASCSEARRIQCAAGGLGSGPCGGGSVGRWQKEGMMPSIMIGLLAISLGLWGLSAWWWSVVELLRGILPLVLVFVGVLALAAGVSGLRPAGKRRDDESLGNDE
ncbi:hypothetical protein CCP1ISM_10013 [Azospirillaceae bacterium]